MASCGPGRPDAVQLSVALEEIKIFKFQLLAEDESQATINMIHGLRSHVHLPLVFRSGDLEYVVMRGNVRVPSTLQSSCGAIKQIHCLDKNETINFYDGSVDV